LIADESARRAEEADPTLVESLGDDVGALVLDGLGLFVSKELVDDEQVLLAKIGVGRLLGLVH